MFLSATVQCNYSKCQCSNHMITHTVVHPRDTIKEYYGGCKNDLLVDGDLDNANGPIRNIPQPVCGPGSWVLFVCLGLVVHGHGRNGLFGSKTWLSTLRIVGPLLMSVLS